jgi:tellurite resistance protein
VACLYGTGGGQLRASQFKNVVEAAKNGDASAMRLSVERLIPVRKGRPVKFDLPAIETPADIANALGAVAVAMAEGEIIPDEANAVAGVCSRLLRLRLLL